MSNDTNSPIPGWPVEPEQPPTVITPQPEPSPAPPPQLPWQPPPSQEPVTSQQPAPSQQPEGWLVPTQSIDERPVFPPPAFPVPPAAPPAGAGRRRRPPLWALIVGGVALAGLVAGLLVWAPWSPPPQAPTAVDVSSPTATTALVSWTAPKGGAAPAQYDILRDGREQGIVPGSQTSWTDTGLAPGTKYSYAVITEGNGQKSAPSATVSVTTITPPPRDVTVTGKTYTTVTLHWSPPLNAPAPDVYTIYNTANGGKSMLNTVASTQTSYTVTQLTAGDDYTFAVTASWGLAESSLSQSQVDAPPLAPPLSGTVPVSVKVTQINPGSTGVTVGQTWTDEWVFTPNCQAASCTLASRGSLQTGVGHFSATLAPESGGYEGEATHVQFSHCSGIDSYNTVIFRLKPDNGAVSNGAWNSWYGTMTFEYPGQTLATSYCHGGDYVFALTGIGS